MRGTFVEEIDYSLPLYVPHTKKLHPKDSEQLLIDAGVSAAERREVMKWLNDKDFYESLLRNTPLNHRQKINNITPPEDVEKILASEIIEEVLDENASPSKCFVRQKSVNDKPKTRRRLIMETRELNRAIKRQKHLLKAAKLPVQSDIEKCMSDTSFVDCFDFKSFFLPNFTPPRYPPFL